MNRIYVDYRKCLACKSCEIACAVHHHPSGSLAGALGDKQSEINVRVLSVEHEVFPLSCRHCDPADCINACPAGALSRDADTGAIIIDPDMCKGCAMCAIVCPYDAISLKSTHRSRSGREVAYKCDLSTDRVRSGGKPACVEACHSGALVFAEYETVRGDRAVKNLRTYLLGDSRTPAPVEFFRELRRKEFARRREGA
jgi:carbon-monoxide dehydrogenase iron sulfur subunit